MAQNSPNEKKFLSLLDVIEGFDQAPGEMDASIDDIYYISQNMVHNSASFNLKQNLIKQKILEGIEIKFSGNKVKAEESDSASDTEMEDQHKVTKAVV